MQETWIYEQPRLCRLPSRLGWTTYFQLILELG